MDLRRKFLKSPDMSAMYTAQVFTANDSEMSRTGHVWLDILSTDLYAEAFDRIRVWLQYSSDVFLRVECMERQENGIHIHHDVYYTDF